MAEAVQSVVQLHRANEFGISTRKIVGSILAVAVPLVLWFAPLNFDATSKHALAVAAFMIVAWITEPIPHALTGLVGCYLFWVLKVVKFEVAFSGFADQTAWFLFGAGLFGMMATKTGLARRLAYLVIQRVGASYSRLLLGIILSSFLLTFLVPSGIACVVIMASVALGLMEVFRLGKGSNIGKGIFITLTYTAGCFDKMVIAGPSTILGRGLIENGANIHVYYSLWLLAFLPCAIVTIFGIWRLVAWLYPPEDAALERGAEFLRSELDSMGPWTAMEKRALFLMLLAIALWMTDLIHHISPAIIGIGIGLLACVPGVGILNQDDMKRLNYLPVFFVATAISMGTVLVQTGALHTMTAIMFDWLRPLVTSSTFALALVPYWTAFIYHIFLGNEISMLATSMPGLMSFAHANGIHPLPLGLIWAFAAGGKIFVYQSGVLVAGYSYGYFKARDVFRVGLCVTVIESLVLLLIVPFYWPFLGIR
jgi:solute carrier family 13 (sodium-dependent dicarboxylate transporter), member 2/3/5